MQAPHSLGRLLERPAGTPRADRPGRGAAEDWLARPTGRRALLAAGLGLGLRGALYGQAAAAAGLGLRPAAGRQTQRTALPTAPAATAAVIYFDEPAGLAVAPTGGLYVAERASHRVRFVAPDGMLTTVAGTGTPGAGGDGDMAMLAGLFWCVGLTLDAAGGLYIADSGNHRVRYIAPDSVISTVAGTGRPGVGGDGGPATDADLSFPSGLALAPDGSLLIADTGNHRVRRVDRAGWITTVAGVEEVATERGGSRATGDEPLGGGPATAARLCLPHDVAVGADGALYIADTGHHRIRRVGPDGLIATVAGTGSPGAAGDGEPAALADLAGPGGVAVAPDGTLLIADTGNHRVRRVGHNGAITTVAGTGVPGWGGDGGPAAGAFLNAPWGVASLPDGSLVIADRDNHMLRHVDPQGTITTLSAPDGQNPDRPRLPVEYATA